MTVSGTITDDLVFPDDLLQVVSFRINVGGVQQELYPNPPGALADLINSAGVPTGYVVINDETGYLDGLDYTMTYLQRIPPLSASAT